MRFIVLPVIRFWINYQKGRRHARVDIELHNVWWARCIRWSGTPFIRTGRKYRTTFIKMGLPRVGNLMQYSGGDSRTALGDALMTRADMGSTTQASTFSISLSATAVFVTHAAARELQR